MADPQVLSELKVEYETVPGWKQSLAQCRNFVDLPPAAQVCGLHVLCCGERRDGVSPFP